MPKYKSRQVRLDEATVKMREALEELDSVEFPGMC